MLEDETLGEKREREDSSGARRGDCKEATSARARDDERARVAERRPKMLIIARKLVSCEQTFLKTRFRSLRLKSSSLYPSQFSKRVSIQRQRPFILDEYWKRRAAAIIRLLGSRETSNEKERNT